MKVAIIQLEISDTVSYSERVLNVISIIENLEPVDLIVLPEIWATGYFSFDQYEKEAESIQGQFVQMFSDIAKRKNVYLFAGSFVEKDGQDLFNTSVLFDRQGELKGKYRKIHLFRYGSREGELLKHGEDIVVVETEFGKIGISTCYDMRFPELYRLQVDLGAEILLITSAWPEARIAHWNLFNATRALENQSYLISCNCVGTTNNIKLGGNSQVVSPWGEVLFRAEDEEIVKVVDIDLSNLAEIRNDFPQLKHRMIQGGEFNVEVSNR